MKVRSRKEDRNPALRKPAPPPEAPVSTLHLASSTKVSADLLRRATAGEESAWRTIVEHYQRLVYATIRSFRITSDAEDLFQEAFLRLYHHLAGLRDSQALTRWLMVTTRNLCIDHLDRCRVRSQVSLEAQTLAVDPAPLSHLIQIERAQLLREAIQELPERCRDLLWKLYFEQDGRDYHAAARAFGMPLGSVGPTRARCLEELLRIVRRKGLER